MMTGNDLILCAAPLEGRPPRVDSGPVAETPAFSSIYRDYFNFVWSCTRRLGTSAEATDDVVQEIFIVIHARLQTLERPEALRSWLYGIVRRTVSTHRRSRRTRDATLSGLPLEYETQHPRPPTPLELAEQSEQVKLLSSLLEELDEEKREVFVLAELEEMTVPEISQAIEIPVNTVYSRLRAARLAFEEALARHAARRNGGGRPCRT
jgi:RNA polymerase sigma-70 factor (ECF subfamily)